jgi:hypothetical protein
MRYETPVLQEVGHSASLVLGAGPGIGDGAGTGQSLVFDLALGLDE